MRENTIIKQLVKIIKIRPKNLIISYFISSGSLIILLAFHFPIWFYLIASYIQSLILIWVGCSIYFYAELPTINQPISGSLAKVIGIFIVFSGLYTLGGYKILQLFF
jgi:hypothetical protein